MRGCTGGQTGGRTGAVPCAPWRAGGRGSVGACAYAVVYGDVRAGGPAGADAVTSTAEYARSNPHQFPAPCSSSWPFRCANRRANPVRRAVQVVTAPPPNTTKEKRKANIANEIGQSGTTVKPK